MKITQNMKYNGESFQTHNLCFKLKKLILRFYKINNKN